MARIEAVKKGAAYMNVWMYAIREFEGQPADAVEELLGSDAAGVFWGVQSLKQLLGKGTSVGGCHIVDWPDFPIRGAYMFGAPRIDRPALG